MTPWALQQKPQPLAIGNLVEVTSDEVHFVASVRELLPQDAVEAHEECVAIYKLRLETAENPDSEPNITLYQYMAGDFFCTIDYEDDPSTWVDYHEVQVKPYKK